MIPRAIWSAQVPPGQHRVLLALWNHAHPWREGDGEWFVWPSVASLAAMLGLQERAVYGRLADLEAGGWIARDTNEGRLGWRLLPSWAPKVVGDATSPPSAGEQLGLFEALPELEPAAAGGPAGPEPTPPESAPVDDLWTATVPDCTDVLDDCKNVQSLPLLEKKFEKKGAGARSFADYERARALRAPKLARVTGDVLVDGVRVDRWEEEAFRRAGADGVREDRRRRLAPEQIAAGALAWLRRAK